MSRRAGNLLAFLISGLVSLALVEAAFRITGPWTPQPVEGLYLPGPPGRHQLAAGFRAQVEQPEFRFEVRTNALGMREREIPARAPGETRILVVGDSFVFGSGVGEDERFTNRLEERLRERGEAVRVLNAGVEGIGTQGALDMLQRVGPTVRPDLVLLAFYLGNDFTDNDEAAAEPGRLHTADEWLRRRLESWDWTRRRLYVLLARSGRRSPLLGDFGSLAQLARYGPAQDVERSARLVRAVEAEAAGMGARFAVLLVPVRAQIYPEQADALWRYYDLEPTEENLTAGNRFFTERLEREGIPCLDLRPALRAVAASTPLYFRVDVHWTPRGHEVVAEDVERFLRTIGLLATPAPGRADVAGQSRSG